MVYLFEWPFTKLFGFVYVKLILLYMKISKCYDILPRLTKILALRCHVNLPPVIAWCPSGYSQCSPRLQYVFLKHSFSSSSPTSCNWSMSDSTHIFPVVFLSLMSKHRSAWNGASSVFLVLGKAWNWQGFEMMRSVMTHACARVFGFFMTGLPWSFEVICLFNHSTVAVAPVLRLNTMKRSISVNFSIFAFKPSILEVVLSDFFDDSNAAKVFFASLNSDACRQRSRTTPCATSYGNDWNSPFSSSDNEWTRSMLL